MKILGLNFGHDAGVALVVDGAFVCHWEKERHCRVKHAIGLRAKDIESALSYFGIALGEIDMVATCTTQNIPLMLYDGIAVEFRARESTNQKPLDAMIESSVGFFHKFKSDRKSAYNRYLATLDCPPDEEIYVKEEQFPFFVHRIGQHFFEMPTYPSILETDPKSHTIDLTLTFAGRRIPGIHVSHHLCHAYYANAQHGRDNGLIITFDGWGSGSFLGGGLYFGRRGRVSPVFPHRFVFGSFYELIGNNLGLGPIGAAGKLMGLAAWGNPVYYDRGLIGSTKEIVRAIGGVSAASLSSPFLVNRWASRMAVPSPSSRLRECERPPQVDADIAASAQAIFTDNVLAVVEASVGIAKAASFSYDRILLSGGCALNCPANSAVFAKFGPRVFVPPAVNDEGNSAGAALCCASLNGDADLRGLALGPAEVAYKGIEYRVTPDLLAGRPELKGVESEDAAKFLAREIARGAVVALFEGKAEIGPRALGHRSLIASPLIAANWKRVNVIKNREFWRPLAPVVLDSEFDRHFEGCPPDSYYMLFNAKVRGTDLPAVTHRDGTARVQVALPECGFIYRLLEAFREETGVGILLNTSFNGRDEPMVETPTQALDTYTAMPIDFLYLQGIVVGRSGGSASS